MAAAALAGRRVAVERQVALDPRILELLGLDVPVRVGEPPLAQAVVAERGERMVGWPGSTTINVGTARVYNHVSVGRCPRVSAERTTRIRGERAAALPAARSTHPQ